MAWGPTTFQGNFGAPLSNVTQGKQRAREDVEVFDEAAFEKAFEQAQQDQLSLESYQAEYRRLEQVNRERLLESFKMHHMPFEDDPVLLRVKETRPSKQLMPL
jgi:hypothetical protein